MSNVAKPEQRFPMHGGPYNGRQIEEVVQDPKGRAWLADHIPTRPPKQQQIALAWLSWGLQREITLDELDEIAGV